MTDPNPLKQAAEEAKARKLAEVAEAREMADQEAWRESRIDQPFEHFNVDADSFMLVTGNSQKIDDFIGPNDKVIDESQKQLWEPILQAEPVQRKHAMIVHPARPGRLRVMIDQLRMAGLRPAGIRMALSVRPRFGGDLYAPGSEARRPGTDVIPVLRSVAGGIELGDCSTALDVLQPEQVHFLVEPSLDAMKAVIALVARVEAQNRRRAREAASARRQGKGKNTP